MEYLLIFVTGVCFGSFLNVCIYRLPIGKSIVLPRSFCPICKTPIKWFDNIPLISFIILKGKCRSCSLRIPIKYPLVELAVGLGGILFFKIFGVSPEFFVYWLFFVLLLSASIIDIEKQIIPDSISLGGLGIGLLAVSFLKINGSDTILNAFLWSAFGGAFGFLLMLSLAIMGQVIFKKEALGGGDIKLMAMIGVFLGWQSVILTFFIAPFFGTFIGLYLKIKDQRDIVPYGPYLALGAIISLIFGKNILSYLFNY